jgi:hypothetical protein
MKVDRAHMVILGNQGVDSTQLFGTLARDEARFYKFLKDTLQLDPETNGAHAIPAARLVMAWESCRKRTEVEVDVQAHRVANHLPPTLSIDDFSTARDSLDRAMEAKGKAALPGHKIPSENYFERKCAEMESFYKCDKLTLVTNLSQEERVRTPQANSNAMGVLEFDSRGRRR